MRPFTSRVQSCGSSSESRAARPTKPTFACGLFDGTPVEIEQTTTKAYVEEDMEAAPMGNGLLEDDLPDVHAEAGAGCLFFLRQNMEHPACRELAKSMRMARVKPHIIRYVAKRFACPVCDAKPRPKPSRPAVLPRMYEPARVVGILDRRQSFLP